MNSKEFVNKLIVFSKEQINYYENKVVEDEKYPSLQQCHKEELKSTQEGLNHFLKIKQDIDRLEQLEKEVEHYEAIIKRWGEKYHLLEKELLQTKKNFRNSQIHSKNCYKKLKEKYTRLERAYKNNEGLVRENVELINRNLKLQDENQELKESYESLKKDYWELDKIEEGILEKFLVQGQIISAIQDEIINKIENETIYEDISPMCEVTIRINKKIFDMLFEKKEVFESAGGSDE